ncbi:glycosyltransferase family 4 protein [Synechococcus sp. EJ6-Ellesmere]|uniref:glycosyltransferase family 4 protein n=1 Tax=Synechococcus sp. EJ6-Ellesmere TaxID=2823734 RepID=UPI0020CD2E52|nr:glycosyltransferase family 4 protein [Synechococcus sp. EJ6-Ellesmere]MCP9825029.1 glycosyltransferase family 4 protein [Synechococcus sp. EJ6-Ellesmere]
MKPIDLLLPELFAADGGIQRYSRTLIQALQVVQPHAPLRVFIRNDHPQHIPTKPWPGISWHPARGSSARMARSLARAARNQRPQLLLSTHPNFAPLQVLHHKLTGSPSWCSAHGIEVWDLRRGPKRWALARLQRLLPVSRFTAARLQLQLGAGCPPIGVLPNSFDQTRFSPGARSPQLLQRYGLHSGQPLILSLSRLSQADAYKNLHKLIEALPALLARWPALRLLIAGEGDDKPRLQSLANQMGVGQQVIFSGRIAEAELADHHRLATVFALPSTGEGFGIVFLEALGCGRPVLAGNRDGSLDPLGDGRFGLLVDPHLPLAPALASLLARQGEDLWFQPQALAQAVGEAFGFVAFCERLDAQLATLEVG